MKTKSLKILSVLLVLAMMLSVVPAAKVSAAGKDFVGVTKVKLWVQNSSAYKRYDYRLYCLEGEKPVIEPTITGLAKGHKYNYELTLYKDHKYFYGYQSYNLTKTSPLAVLPELSAGNYMIEYKLFGDDVVAKEFNFELNVMKKNAFDFTNNLYTYFGISMDENLFIYSKGLSQNLDSAKYVAGNVFRRSNLMNYSNDVFVKTLYKGLLQREYDNGGLSYWKGKLDSNKLTKAQVYQEFVNSSEFKNLCKNKGLAW